MRTKISDNTLPILPLRDIVVFPNMIVPLFVGRKKSIKALEKAEQENKDILLVAQRMQMLMNLMKMISIE